MPVASVCEALPTLSEEDVQRAAANLVRADLISTIGSMQLKHIHVRDVSERALRITGLWPDEEQAADQLLWVLEQKITAAVTTDERNRWKKIREAVSIAGRDIAVELAAGMAARSIGA